MTRASRARRGAVTAVLVAVLGASALSACSTSSAAHSPKGPATPTSARPSPPARPSGTSPVAPARTGDYAAAVHAALRHGLQVWLEADLVKRWREGSDSFDAALVQVGSLAAIPGVIGVKIADELGYGDGLDSTAQVTAFLNAASAGMHRVAPGKPLLVDMIVPQLGCLPDHQPPLLWSTECTVKLAGQYPQLMLSAVTSYLHLGVISVLDLSTGLLPDTTYGGWGTDRDTAQKYAWSKATRLGWGSLVTLHARKALAHPGTYSESDSTAAADVHTWVDIPLESGASAVDVWTWRQKYQGDINRLLDPELKPNVLWEQLMMRRAHGAKLFTHLSPHSLEVGLDADLSVLAEVFAAVFIAAGTG
jgi:hypothetical protein